MAVVEIYNQGQLITKKEVTTFFVSSHSFVPVAREVLFWRIGNNTTRWETDDDSVPPEALEHPRAADHLMLFGGDQTKITFGARYCVHTVRPDWQMKINDIECQKGVYGFFQVLWPKIELSYQSYQFIFFFSEDDIDIGDKSSEICLPAPG